MFIKNASKALRRPPHSLKKSINFAAAARIRTPHSTRLLLLAAGAGGHPPPLKFQLNENPISRNHEIKQINLCDHSNYVTKQNYNRIYKVNNILCSMQLMQCKFGETEPRSVPHSVSCQSAHIRKLVALHSSVTLIFFSFTLLQFPLYSYM